MNRILLVMLLISVMAACSDQNQLEEGDHVWKEQTQMIDKAKDVEQLINKTAEQQQQLIEQKYQ